jgi:hypothetical protein
MTEAPADPHLAARGSYATVDGVVQPSPAPRFGDAAPGTVFSALPPGTVSSIGAHTREVLAGLGFDDTEELVSSGAVWQALPPEGAVQQCAARSGTRRRRHDERRRADTGDDAGRGGRAP